MESQKIINLLDSSDNESQKFATKRWYIINDQNTGNNAYGNGEDGTTIKFETKIIKPNFCDYSDAYILVIGNIQNKPANSVVAFKNCASFRIWDVTINDEHVEKVEDLEIVMPMYNLLEYSADEAADAPVPRNLVANRVVRDSYRKYFVPRVDITSYNVLIDGRNFYDRPINDSIRKYDEIRKIATGKGDNYATGCLLDYDYFKKNYQLIAVDLSKQRELDADPQAIQQIEFIGMLKTRSNVFTILEKSKETILEFYKGTA